MIHEHGAARQIVAQIIKWSLKSQIAALTYVHLSVWLRNVSFDFVRQYVKCQNEVENETRNKTKICIFLSVTNGWLVARALYRRTDASHFIFHNFNFVLLFPALHSLAFPVAVSTECIKMMESINVCQKWIHFYLMAFSPPNISSINLIVGEKIKLQNDSHYLHSFGSNLIIALILYYYYYCPYFPKCVIFLGHKEQK